MEMKMLIFNKVKRGMSYDQAKKELEKEIKTCIENSKTKKKDNPNFKEEFDKLRNGKATDN
jgi:hypothetical protein